MAAKNPAAIPMCLLPRSLRLVGAALGLLMGTLAVAAAEDAVSIVRPTELPVVVSGAAEKLPVTLRNAGAGAAEIAVDFRVLQLSSATAVPLGEPRAWKPMILRDSQTIVESLDLTLPEVRALTLFKISFTTKDAPLGALTVLALPPGLLASLAADHPFLLVDPQSRLQPVLEKLGVKTARLDEGELPAGSVVIAGPFSTEAEMPADLSARLTELARRGVPVLALLPARGFARAGSALARKNH